jgi:uncharacterized protein (DUF927 family)
MNDYPGGKPPAFIPFTSSASIGAACETVAPDPQRAAQRRVLKAIHTRVRQNVFARRWTGKDDKAGYEPAGDYSWSATTDGKRKKVMIGAPFPFEELRLNEHLLKTNNPADAKTYGAYVVRPDNTVQVAVIDIDAKVSEETGQPGRTWSDVQDIRTRITAWLAEHGGVPVWFRSRGGHGANGWLFWDEPQPAANAKRLLDRCVFEVTGREAKDGDVERFPKQETIGEDGFGNLVCLPFAGKGAMLDPFGNDMPVPPDWTAPISQPLPEQPVFTVPSKKPQAGAPESFGWFGMLDTATKNTVVRKALDHVDNRTPGTDDYARWLDVVWACRDAGKQGATEAREACIQWSRQGARYEDDDAVLAKLDQDPPADKRGITIGTLLRIAMDARADFSAERTGATGLQHVPVGYELDADGWHKVNYRKKAENEIEREAVHICTPFDVLGESRNDDNRGWGLVIQFADRDGVAQQVVVKRTDTLGDGMVALNLLVDAGLTLGDTKNAGQLLVPLLRALKARGRVRYVRGSGWTREGAYVLPGGRVLGRTTEQVALDPDVAGRDNFRLCETGGTLEGWKTGVSRLAAGNSRPVLFISQALAAPLARLLNMQGGGVHLSGVSQGGKTTSLRCGASVWGKPFEGHAIRSWSTTSNGAEGIAAAHNDRFLAMDEIGRADPKALGKMLYDLAGGSGKQRAGITGAARTVAEWLVDYGSTGEHDLASYMRAAGVEAQAGQLVRCASIPADAGAGIGAFEQVPAGMSPKTFSDALADNAMAHHGHAGPAFVEALIKAVQKGGREAVISMVRKEVERVAAEMQPADASPQVASMARRFARYTVAGELATVWGITGWPGEEATRAARRCFTDWLEARGGAGAMEGMSVLERLRSFIDEFGNLRFVEIQASGQLAAAPGAPGGQVGGGVQTGDELVTGDAKARLSYQGQAGFWRTQPGGGRIYLMWPEVFRREIIRSLEERTAFQALGDAGYVVTSEEGGRTRFQLKRPTPAGKRRVVVVDPAAWADGEDNGTVGSGS